MNKTHKSLPSKSSHSSGRDNYNTKRQTNIKYQVVTGPMKKVRQNKVMGAADLKGVVRDVFPKEAHLSRSGVVVPAGGIVSAKSLGKDQVHLLE